MGAGQEAVPLEPVEIAPDRLDRDPEAPGKGVGFYPLMFAEKAKDGGPAVILGHIGPFLFEANITRAISGAKRKC